MGVEINQDDVLLASRTSSILLELAALDDVQGFKLSLEQLGCSIDELGLWYTRRIGSNKMSYEQRTPLMVAAQYGSLNVLDYIIGSGQADLNRTAGSDRVSALHCAVAGGSQSAPVVVDRLIANSVIVDSKAADLIPRFPQQQQLNQLNDKLLLENKVAPSLIMTKQLPQPGSPERQQQLPDINNEVYSSDEFRMYCFKIVPCSRAYTHDWTECPFAHPGENAKRRDPKKHQYTCVPCPEFKKGTCKKGDDCEFAHGVFESWLHPAQYRTRLCKDETGCSRKVCFFAHKKVELRPVYQSTGSAIPGPDMGSSGMSTPPLSPSFSPKSGGYNNNNNNHNNNNKMNLGVSPPSLQLPGSRLRSSFSARDVELERELMKIEHQFLQQQHQQHQQQQQQQQQQMLSPRPSPRWSGEMSPANLETAFASINVARKLSPPRALDSSPKSVAAAMLNSRAAAFAAKRSQSFIDRATGGYGGAATGAGSGSNLSSTMSGNLADWGSPNGRLEWGVQGEELNKLRKSNSFAYRGNGNRNGNGLMRTSSPPGFNEPDVSWVNSLVKDEVSAGFLGARRASYGGVGAGGNGVQVQDMRSPWVDQLYMEQELVA